MFPLDVIGRSGLKGKFVFSTLGSEVQAVQAGRQAGGQAVQGGRRAGRQAGRQAAGGQAIRQAGS